MYRMTHEKTNGKAGYWSPNKKEEVVNRLATYENTGLEPRHVQEFLKKLQKLQLKSCEDIEPASKEFLDECREVAKKYEKKNDGWIPVEERMPKEHPSIFANLKGTAAWNNAMFENFSDEVNITIENEKGEVRTAHAYTVDGVWKSDFLRLYPRCCVIAWRPLPEPYRPERSEGE